MKISEAFPSKFLKVDDLNGNKVTVVIQDAQIEEIGQAGSKEKKLVLSFRGKDKQLVLNKTNATSITKLYGDDTDGWIGNPITLMPAEVESFGEMVMAIRVSIQKPAPVASAKPASSPKPVPVQANAAEIDEDVPF